MIKNQKDLQKQNDALKDLLNKSQEQEEQLVKDVEAAKSKSLQMKQKLEQAQK